jgi:hypothetical protein
MAKTALTIYPDYDYSIIDQEGCVYDYQELDELCGDDVQIEGLEEWCKEIRPVVIEAAMGRTYSMNWKDYHQRGIALARELRKVLPKHYELWYEAPFEDDSGTIPERILIQ